MQLPALDQLFLFLTIAETGSFAKAGQKLGVPSTTVSRKFAELEQLLGVELIHRTTRKLSLSSEGKVYLEQFQPLLREAESLQVLLNQRDQEPQGLLRITAPVSYGIYQLQKKIHDYQMRYPRVRVQIFLKNEYVDLVGEGFDAAIRVAPLTDSTLVARKIDVVGYCCVAVPDFIKRYFVPKTPDDLTELPCIGLAPDLGIIKWQFQSPAGEKNILLNPFLVVNDPLYALQSCLDGGGIANLPNFIVQDALRDGRLVQLLPAWQPRSRDIMLVFHHRKLVSPAMRALLNIITC